MWSLLCKCFEPTIMNSKYVRIILRYILNIRKYNYIFFVYEISSIVFSKSQIWTRKEVKERVFRSKYTLLHDINQKKELTSLWNIEQRATWNKISLRALELSYCCWSLNSLELRSLSLAFVRCFATRPRDELLNAKLASFQGWK